MHKAIRQNRAKAKRVAALSSIRRAAYSNVEVAHDKNNQSQGWGPGHDLANKESRLT